MELEKRLSEYVSNTQIEDLPKEAISTAKRVVLNIIGTTVTGATTEGCEALTGLVRKWGGREETTIFVHGIYGERRRFVDGGFDQREIMNLRPKQRGTKF